MTNEDKLEDKLREKLAAYAHEAWTGWMEYMVSKIEPGLVRQKADSYLVQGWLPADLRDRWERQMETPYEELPESEKESDRAEANKILALVLGDNDE